MTAPIELRPLIVAVLFSGCAITPLPPVPADHPASSQAAEGAPPPRNVIVADAATKRTRQLLDGSATPSAPSADREISSMPGMQH